MYDENIVHAGERYEGEGLSRRGRDRAGRRGVNWSGGLPLSPSIGGALFEQRKERLILGLIGCQKKKLKRGKTIVQKKTAKDSQNVGSRIKARQNWESTITLIKKETRGTVGAFKTKIQGVLQRGIQTKTPTQKRKNRKGHSTPAASE